VCGQRPRPGRFIPGKNPVPFAYEVGWNAGPVLAGAEDLAPTGIRSADHPALASRYTGRAVPPHHSPTARNQFIGKCHVIKISSERKTCKNNRDNYNQGQSYRPHFFRTMLRSEPLRRRTAYLSQISLLRNNSPTHNLQFKMGTEKIRENIHTFQLSAAVQSGYCRGLCYRREYCMLFRQGWGTDLRQRVPTATLQCQT
jgi:hypothetical protein